LGLLICPVLQVQQEVHKVAKNAETPSLFKLKMQKDALLT